METTSRTRTREAPDVRREQILDAATQVFLARGIAEATMADVAGAAGIAKGTVYLYFDSKVALITALQTRYADTMAERAGALLAIGGRGSRLRRMDAFIEGFAALHEEQHELHHLLFRATGASEGPLFDRLRDSLKRFIEDGVAAGEFAVPDIVLTVDFLLQGLHGVEIAAHRGTGQPTERVVSVAQQLARKLLSAG